jgi:AraC-like DNA-binding protein
MELATRWLRDDAMTISEVSQRLGYSSEAAFSRAFKRATGTTPGAAARHHTD